MTLEELNALPIEEQLRLYKAAVEKERAYGRKILSLTKRRLELSFKE